MSRVAPTLGTKFLYVLCILFSIFLIYTDLKLKWFGDIKNLYHSVIISTKYVIKTTTIKPFTYLYQTSIDKNELINENKKLKLELDKSYISNFIISQDSKFFADDEAIKYFLDLNNLKEVFYLAKLKYFDYEMYLCCNKHRILIEVSGDENFIGSVVINKDGIIGQIINENSLSEVLLLTDVNHVLPIVSGNQFCNARGSGKPGIITCSYNNKLWLNQVFIDQEFLSSGMGGIYPKDLLIGRVGEIRQVDENVTEFDINLISSPETTNVFGVFKGL